MSELEKKIRGDWYEIRNSLDNPDDIVDFLKIRPQDFSQAAERLRYAVDEGVVEYKRELLRHIMMPLKSLKWDSRAITKLNDTIKGSTMAIFTPLVQRLFAKGILRLYSHRSEEDETKLDRREQQEQDAPDSSGPDMKTIIAEVRKLIQEQPEMKTNPEVKKILLQLKVYNSEMEKMRSLAPNIPKEQAEGFKRNFKETFGEINSKIKSAYQNLMAEKEKSYRPEEHRPILKRYNFSEVEPIYHEQIENAVRIYSTISFAVQERFQMREILVELGATESYHEESFKKELELYSRLAPFGEESLKISRAYRDQISQYYQRYADWLST